VADACVDDVDFRVENGQLRLFPHQVFTGSVTFVHVLDGVNGVYEQITELPGVVAPEDGIWVITGDARGEALITPAAIGTDVEASVSVHLAVNGVLVLGSETMVARLHQDAPASVQPELEIQNTGSVTRIVSLSAGDVVTLWGARTSDAGTTSQIVSNNLGRTRITMHRTGGL
jgi:hypothetical protein